MDLETFRAIDVDIDLANDFVPDVILSANDYNGRCIVARVTNGGVSVSGDNLSARLLFNAAPGISPGGYVTMAAVASSPTATWQVPVPSDALAARQVMLCVQIVDSDGYLICSRNFRGIVDRQVLDDGATESVNELNRLWEGIDALEQIDASVSADGTVSVTAPDGTVTTSTAVPTAVSAANSATSAANTAATAANTAATAASTAADDANAAAARAEEAAKPTEEMFASYHALLKAGASEGIASDAPSVQSSFLNRASGSAEGVRDGIATIECIKGNTVGWNQLVNLALGNNNTGLTITLGQDGSMTLDGTATGGDALITGNITFTESRKCLVKGCPAGGGSDTYWLGIGGGVGFADIGGGRIVTRTAGSAAMRLHVAEGQTFSNVKTYPQLFDLTAMFGAGNEPSSVEEFERLYPLPYYPYDAGTLKPVQMTGIESTGFNLLDPARIAALDSSIVRSGDTFTGTLGAFRSHMAVGWEGIEYFPNTSYEVSLDYTISSPVVNFRLNVMYTDGTFDASQQKPPGSGKLRVSSDPSKTVARIMFNYGADGPCVISNFCIHLAQDGTRNGEYEPHWGQLREIDLARYFPTGLKSAGTAADALYKDHADTVIGSVDLGTLTWEKLSYTNRTVFKASYSGMLVPSGAGDLNCFNYAAANKVIETLNDKECCRSTAGKNVFIRDESFADKTAADFKSAMNGVTLYYEAAHVTVEIDPPLNLGCRVSDFGTERVMLANGVISAPPVFDIAYGYTAESLRDAAASIVAPVENHLAQDNYAIGSYLVRNGVLYKVTAAIARNEAIVPGTNVTATTVMAEIAAING